MTVNVELTQSPISETTALTDIVTWSINSPIWQRDALRRLYTQDKIEAADFDELLALCKEDDASSAVFLTSDHLRDFSAKSAVVTLRALYNLQHVNALANNQLLTFNTKGITIIYGDNGAGKSGYARVLKKVCRARSLKGETILSNVYTSNNDLPTASIEFCVNASNQNTTWENGQIPDARLSAVSIFDCHTASIHINQTNDIAYTPMPLKLLADLAGICQELQARLTAEIKALIAQKPAMLITPKCQPGTKVGKLVTKLSAKTPPEDIAILTKLSSKELARIETLKIDLAADPAKTVRKLHDQKTKIETALSSLMTLTQSISNEQITALRVAHTNFIAAKAAAIAASANLFSGEPLPDIGSDTWKILWESARAYSQTSAYPGQVFPVTDNQDSRCVLCQQELDTVAADRLKRFEDFMVNDSKNRERAAHKIYDEVLFSFRNAMSFRADFSKLLTLIRDDLDDIVLAEELRRAGVQAFWRLRAILRTHQEAITTILPTVEPLPITALQCCIQNMENRIVLLSAPENSPEKLALQNEKSELEDRVWLSSVQTDIFAQVRRLKAIAELNKAKRNTTTNRITSKSAEIAQFLVTNRLRSRFTEEVDKLGVSRLAIELQQDKPANGVPFFRVSLINSPTETVGNVLSEGEHRCVALAAFLAELSTVDARNRPVKP